MVTKHFECSGMVLLTELRWMVEQAGVEVRYDTKFFRVIYEDGKSATFEFAVEMSKPRQC